MNTEEIVLYNKKVMTNFIFSSSRHITVPWTLAGGAVRDYLLNKKIKDFDVFIHISFKNKVFKRFPYRGTWITDNNDYYKKNFEVYSIPFSESPTIQLIFYNLPIRWVIREFDIDLCKVAIDMGNIGKKALFISTDFIKCVDKKELRYNSNKLRNNDHLERVRKKFPTYTMIDCATWDEVPF